MDAVVVLDKRDVSTRQIHCQAPLMFVLPLKVYSAGLLDMTAVISFR